jgi:hypothetical protein
MSRKRRKAGLAGKGLQKGKKSRRGQPFITREEAKRRAKRHVLERMFKGAEVRDGAKVSRRIYKPTGWKRQAVWAVYKNSPEVAFKSAEVVLVSKRTGKVVYEGSANDEG